MRQVSFCVDESVRLNDAISSSDEPPVDMHITLNGDTLRPRILRHIFNSRHKDGLRNSSSRHDGCKSAYSGGSIPP